MQAQKARAARRSGFVFMRSTLRIVDRRCSDLQGAALYICSDKPLGREDIRRMQQVNRSEKRLDFLSCGRFGVGMNVMYRYSDCPLLLANGRLHFFDLTRGYVAHEGQKRGKQFNVQHLQQDFPDTWLPFRELSARFPVIFRLPLRKGPSALASAVSEDDVREKMGEVMRSSGAGMLLFCKSLESLTFTDLASEACIRHRVEYRDPSHKEMQRSFFRRLVPEPDAHPAQALDEDVSVSLRKSISTSEGSSQQMQEWAIVHRATGSDEELRLLSAEFYNQDHGFAVLPYASAAVRTDVDHGTEGDGYICCGLPTPERSGSPAWINGSFVFTSSRKHFPLPEASDQSPEKRWNLKLLQGPAAWCLKELLLVRQDRVATLADLDAYFSLLPDEWTSSARKPPSILAEYALRAGLHDAIFPEVFFTVASEVSVRWVRGPAITLTAEPEKLPQTLQARLAADGLQLVHLPPHVRTLYGAIRAPCEVEVLSAAQLCRFLQDLWRRRGHQTSVHLNQTGAVALGAKSQVLQLLAFVQQEDWQSRIQRQAVPEVHTCDHLLNVPLLLLADERLCTFGTRAFKSGHGLLPQNQELFVHKDALHVLRDIPLALPDVRTRVKVEPISLRRLRIADLWQYREGLEAAMAVQPKWAENTLLKDLWSLMHDEAKDRAIGARRVMEAVWDWRIFPVLGAPGPQLATLGTHASWTLWPSADFSKVSGACARLDFCWLQHDFAESECSWMVGAQIISKPRQLLERLVDLQGQSGLDRLCGRDRHDLLAFLAVLWMQGEEPIKEMVSKLPLFKLAMSRSAFTPLGGTTHYCCIEPTSPGIAEVEAVAVAGTMLLAWPTQQTEPIYKHCGVSLYHAEGYVRKYILPVLPELIVGPSSERAWDALHKFVVQLEMASLIEECKKSAFVGTRSGPLRKPEDILDWQKSPLAGCFEHVLLEHLPRSDLQVNASVL